MAIDAEFARDEYNALTYDTRCWIRLRTLSVGAMMLGIGALMGGYLV